MTLATERGKLQTSPLEYEDINAELQIDTHTK